MVAPLVYYLQTIALLLSERAIEAILQKLIIANDTIEWRAQLVAYVC